LKYKLLFFILILLSNIVDAQENIDSLYAVWNNDANEDTSRLNALDDYIYYAYLKKGNDSASYYANIQIAYAKEKGFPEYLADGYYNLAGAFSNNGELSKAINYFKKSLLIYEDQGNKRKSLRALSKIGHVHWTAGEYDIAKGWHRKALAIAREIDDKVRIYKCLNGLSYCYFQQSEYDTSEILLEQSIKICEKIGDDYGIAWGLNAMGVSYSRQGNDEKALEYYLRGLEINERIGDQLSISYSLRNIGIVYSHSGDDEKAMEYYKKSMLIAEELNDKRSLANSLWSIGNIYSKQGEKKMAMEYLQRSLLLSREIGNRDMESGILGAIGWLHMDDGDYALCISECQKSFDIALEIGSIENQMDACECLYKANKKAGLYSKALSFHEEMLTLKDSINFESLANNLQLMEYNRQHFTDSLQHEEEKLKTELAHQAELRTKKRNQNIFLVSGLIVLLIALGLWNRMRFTRKANAQLKIERDRAEHSELVKHQFLANMSHEIRTPMNAIKGMIDILMRRKPKAEQVSYLESVKEASNSLLVIINDILDLSKIESGKIELEHIPFTIPEMLQNVYTIMQFKAEEKGLELKLDIPSNIPEVKGDPMHLRQVLINLIGNAIKFTEKGIVNTKLVLAKDQNNSILNAHFTVSDTGIGIDEDRLEQVFNSFEQAYADTSRKFGGTGLGLTISRKLIELHDGKIWVESKKGAGSQFHFTIPFKLSADKEKVDRESESIDIESISNQLQGLKVLLVEDNAFNVVVAKEELEDAIEDVKVSVAENGAIAIEQVRNGAFDIVLMDVQMPVMNGYDATTGIRNLSDDKSSIPIIAMTANVLKEEVALCYKAGMNDFIGKPFEIDILIQKIHSLTKA